jgi:hypothetical protein
LSRSRPIFFNGLLRFRIICIFRQLRAGEAGCRALLMYDSCITKPPFLPPPPAAPKAAKRAVTVEYAQRRRGLKKKKYRKRVKRGTKQSFLASPAIFTILLAWLEWVMVRKVSSDWIKKSESKVFSSISLHGCKIWIRTLQRNVCNVRNVRNVRNVCINKIIYINYLTHMFLVPVQDT